MTTSDALDPVLDRFDERYFLDHESAVWRAKAAAFARDVLAPISRDADRAGALPEDVIPALGAAGLIGAPLQTEAGGGGASTLASCCIAEEIGAVDGSVRGFLAVQTGLVCTPLWTFGTQEQHDAWLPGLIAGTKIGSFALTEPEAGSDVGAMQTMAREDGNDVVIDGEKIWITNGVQADVYLVFAQTDPKLRTKGLACYVVPADTPGLSREPMPGNELGHRASNHAHLRFEGLRVPQSARLGAPREGFRVAMTGLAVGRLNVAAGAVGIQRACLSACIAYARTRRQFGRRIGDFQQVGAALADLMTEGDAARLLTHQAARLRDSGQPAADAAVSQAKLYATEAAVRAATQAIQLHGARGYTDELPVERHLRDALALTIYEGTSNVQRVILARHLLGKDEDPGATKS